MLLESRKLTRPRSSEDTMAYVHGVPLSLKNTTTDELLFELEDQQYQHLYLTRQLQLQHEQQVYLREQLHQLQERLQHQRERLQHQRERREKRNTQNERE